MPSHSPFGRKHYDILAAWWKTEPLHKPECERSLLRFATEMLNTNSNFNAVRFLQACGYPRAKAEALAERCYDAHRAHKYSTNKVVNDEAR